MASAGVLVVAALALPWGTGYLTQQQWQQATQEVNGSQAWIELELGRYQRGFWSSEFEGVMRLIDPASGEAFTVPYLANVSHGVSGSLTDFKPRDGWVPAGTDWFAGEEPRLTAETRLWGTMAAELTVPEFTLAGQDGETVFGSGGTLRVEGAVGSKSADISAQWASLVVASEELDIRARDLSLAQTLEHLSGDIWTGEGTLVLQTLELMPADEMPIGLQGLVIDTRSEAGNQGRTLDSRLSMALEQLSLADEALGPHRISFEVSGLDVAAWDALSSSVAQMQLAALAVESGNTAALQQQMLAMVSIGEALQQLAAAGFSAGFPELILASPDGPVNGHVFLSHPGLPAGAAAQPIMPALEGDMALSIPLALAENNELIRLQTAPLIKQGLLVTEGDQLVLKATLKDLILMVNGQPIPVPALM